MEIGKNKENFQSGRVNIMIFLLVFIFIGLMIVLLVESVGLFFDWRKFKKERVEETSPSVSPSLSPLPTVSLENKEDSTLKINKDIENIDILELNKKAEFEAELQELRGDLNAL